MRTPLRQLGNSRGVILPKPILAQLGIGDDDCLDMQVEKDRIVLRLLPRTARAGWADAASSIAAADDAPVWPDFPNEADSGLVW